MRQLRAHGVRVLTVRDILAYNVDENVSARVDLEDLAFTAMEYEVSGGGVFYSCLGHREGAYNPCPKWDRIYRLMTESGSKAFPASRAPEG